MRVVSYGFLTGPANGLRFVLVIPNASSCMFVLPSTIAPASISFCSDGAVVIGTALRSAGVPAVVGRSFMLMLSLTTIARPASGGKLLPALCAASIRRAASSAPVLLSVMNA